jgi:hypothetical protein
MPVIDASIIDPKLAEGRKRLVSIRLAHILMKAILELEPVGKFLIDLEQGDMSPQLDLMTYYTNTEHGLDDKIVNMATIDSISNHMSSSIDRLVALEPWMASITLRDLFSREKYYLIDLLETLLGANMHLKQKVVPIGIDSHTNIVLSIVYQPGYEPRSAEVLEIWPDLGYVTAMMIPSDPVNSDNDTSEIYYIAWPASIWPYWLESNFSREYVRGLEQKASSGVTGVATPVPHPTEDDIPFVKISPLRVRAPSADEESVGGPTYIVFPDYSVASLSEITEYQSASAAPSPMPEAPRQLRFSPSLPSLPPSPIPEWVPVSMEV